MRRVYVTGAAAPGADPRRPRAGAAPAAAGETDPRWTSGHAVLLDLGLRSNPDDLFLVPDLDSGAFVEQFSTG